MNPESDITMSERRISPLEKRICDRLDDLARQIDENKQDRKEQISTIFSWMNEQNQHCRKVHSSLDISLTALRTDYNNTKQSLKDTKEIIQDRSNSKMEFKSRLAVALIAICVSALFGACSWIVQKILEK